LFDKLERIDCLMGIEYRCHLLCRWILATMRTRGGSDLNEAEAKIVNTSKYVALSLIAEFNPVFQFL